ncbi:MAG: hypothetical protein AB8G15_18440 [Saprospiraceae bacterium]
MLKLLKLAILFLWVFSSCNSKKDTNLKNNSNNYSKTNFDFTEGTIKKTDTFFFNVTIELLLDANQLASWQINGENISKSALLPTLEKIQLSYPERKRNSIAIHLGIDKNAGIQDFLELRDSLRIGNYLGVSYLNAKHQKLKARFRASHKMHPSKRIPQAPPRPPGIEESICLCCEKEGDFTSYIFNRQSKNFKSYFDCMKGDKLTDCYTYVHVEQDKFYWEGKEMPLATIADRLQQEYTTCVQPNRFFTILKIDSQSKFESYLKLYTACKKNYVDQWNEEALQKFGALYQDLSRKNKREVMTNYPIILVNLFGTED